MNDAWNTGATYDAMTRLKDRMTFFNDITRRKAEGNRAHILLIHPSQLIWVNRKYGILAGDQLIRDIARYLDTLDPGYSAYRIASSRFMLIGPACTQQEADTFAARVRERFDGLWQIAVGEQTYSIRAKAYLVHLFLAPEDTWENTLLDKINYALSSLSRRGSDGMVFFDEATREAMQHREYVLREIRYAIDHRTFQMYYQPIYNCREGRFTSAESLIRLFSRDGAFISPGEFIPMAEDNGLIDQISWIVLEKVCRFLGSHPELPLDTASVNLTGQQILDPAFISRIEDLLADCRLDGRHLRLEITERTITEDFDEVKRVMERLAERGIRFYLDDFGTGYSNLASMLLLPFEVIKFDQSLIKIMMDGTLQGQRTIGLLAEIMHENHYKIVAEGIETEAQAQMAHETGLDRIQGFFYSRPLPEGELIKFLAGK